MVISAHAVKHTITLMYFAVKIQYLLCHCFIIPVDSFSIYPDFNTGRVASTMESRKFVFVFEDACSASWGSGWSPEAQADCSPSRENNNKR